MRAREEERRAHCLVDILHRAVRAQVKRAQSEPGGPVRCYWKWLLHSVPRASAGHRTACPVARPAVARRSYFCSACHSNNVRQRTRSRSQRKTVSVVADSPQNSRGKQANQQRPRTRHRGQRKRERACSLRVRRAISTMWSALSSSPPLLFSSSPLLLSSSPLTVRSPQCDRLAPLSAHRLGL